MENNWYKLTTQDWVYDEIQIVVSERINKIIKEYRKIEKEFKTPIYMKMKLNESDILFEKSSPFLQGYFKELGFYWLCMDSVIGSTRKIKVV